MVSKIAVIALVAIVACPILLGYAMNIEETTVTDYKSSNDSVNVTPLLQSGTEWSYAAADPTQLNNPTTSFRSEYANTGAFIPFYNKITNVKTTTPYTHNHVNSWGAGGSDFTLGVPNYLNYDVIVYYNVSPSNYVTAKFYNLSNTLLFTLNYFTHFNYDATNNRITYYAYTSNAVGSSEQPGTFGFNNETVDHIDYTIVGGAKPLDYSYVEKSGNATYADISSGWYFGKYSNQPISYMVGLPNNTNSIIFTINLDSITASDYSVVFSMQPIDFLFEKTTTGGVAKYTLKNVTGGSPGEYVDFELYYDPTRSDNTYQIYCDLTKTSEDSSYKYYNQHIECRYVGGWPTIIGKANSYMTYSGDVPHQTGILAPDVYFSRLSIYANNSYGDVNAARTPTMRMDAATFRAFEKPIIENSTYVPSAYRSNPATTISGDYLKGYSFTFGGNTYLLDKDNNITMSSHKIPVNGIVLDSIPAEGGGYDNRINGTVISNTASPSTIVFNGKWNASISTESMESYTYTKTEWKAGEFAWDGIDHNFLLVGLITCLGVFIGCGIYARKSRSGGIIPLMIITGCAAFVFFIML